jgi:hypothetical protein
MADLTTIMEQNQGLPEDEQKKIAAAIPGAMGDDHTDFVKIIARMITEKEIDVTIPETFLHKDMYEKLDEQSRAQVDLAMVNIADLLRHIAEFYMSPETPDASPQLQTMIEQLWQMKERVEQQYGDVFKF